MEAREEAKRQREHETEEAKRQREHELQVLTARTTESNGATLVRGMRKVLDGIPNVGVYIDDIILYNETFEEHMGNLNKVFQRLKDHNLTIKSTKCSFAIEEIDFIGVKITRGTSLPVNENIEKIQKPTPYNQKISVKFSRFSRILSKLRTQLLHHRGNSY